MRTSCFQFAQYAGYIVTKCKMKHFLQQQKYIINYFIHRVHIHNKHSSVCSFHGPNLCIRCTAPFAPLGLSLTSFRDKQDTNNLVFLPFFSFPTDFKNICVLVFLHVSFLSLFLWECSTFFCSFIFSGVSSRIAVWRFLWLHRCGFLVGKPFLIKGSQCLGFLFHW